MARVSVSLSIAGLLLAGQLSAKQAEPSPTFKLDLRDLGYVEMGYAPSRPRNNFTDLAFLSDDLLLISINQRSAGTPVRWFGDSPDSKLVLIDLRSGHVTAKAEMPVEKWFGSVQAIAGGRFAVMSESGLKFCGSDLRCGAPIPGRSPLVVSPLGITVAVMRSDTAKAVDLRTIMIDVDSLHETVFDFRLQKAVPGDRAFLVSDRSGDKEVTILHANGSSSAVSFKGLSQLSSWLGVNPVYLNASLLAYFDHDPSRAIVSDLNGQPQYQHRTQPSGRFITSLSGLRFGIYEYGYTFLSTLFDHLDVSDPRVGIHRLRVFDCSSGVEKSEFRWKSPEGTLALSYSGSRIARIRNGILEVLQVNP